MRDPSNVRDEAARFYERALKPAGGGSCCGAPDAGPIAIATGYDTADLANLPADAIGNSFGCGNPLAFASVTAGQAVLDVGAGAGLDLIIAGGRVGPEGRVIGVDLSDAMLARARANVEQAGLANVELRQGGIEHLPVESGSVDWVISNCDQSVAGQGGRLSRRTRRRRSR